VNVSRVGLSYYNIQVSLVDIVRGPVRYVIWMESNMSLYPVSPFGKVRKPGTYVYLLC
jgi:hypothetical protein